MSFTVTLSPPVLTTCPYSKRPSYIFRNPKIILLKSHSFQTLFASRRTPNFPQVTGNLVDGPHNWSRSITAEFDDDQEVDEDEEEDRSLDLLVRFVQSVFRKISKRARKAVRSVLPVSIPSNLVVCTLGSVVFVSILIVRGIWTGVTYMQESRERRINELVDDQHMWTGAQPAT